MGIRNMFANKKGQALIIILLVMSVSLTLGISVASRAISTLRQVSFVAQSAQSLAFAEAGVGPANFFDGLPPLGAAPGVGVYFLGYPADTPVNVYWVDSALPSQI